MMVPRIVKLYFLLITLYVAVKMCIHYKGVRRIAPTRISPRKRQILKEGYRNDSTPMSDKRLILVLGSNPPHPRAFGYGQTGFRRDCHTDRCELTNDVRKLPEAHCILFFVFYMHEHDVIPPDMNVPQVQGAPGYPLHTNRQQIFVFFQTEPPGIKSRNVPFNHLNDYFNLTMTYLYHPDTDIIRRYLVSNPGQLLSEIDLKKFVKGKHKLVAWVVTNCQTPQSLRNRYAKALSKYIPVDVYGKCGKPCNDTWNTITCFEKIAKTYKFYLAFENSQCVDYITEKATRILQLYIVPITLNGADNERLLPPYSYIDARKFQSPRHLAQYLKRLDSNDDEYMKYFEWKKHFKPNHVPNSFCKLCQILLNKESKYKTHFNVAQYWNESSFCKNASENSRLFGNIKY